MKKITKKIALIFGVTGQDGSYLSELLLNKGYIVHGVKEDLHYLTLKELTIFMTTLMILKNFLHYGDMTDSLNIINLIKSIKPSEIYNLAAQSHVQVISEIPEYTSNIDAIGTLRILEAIKTLGLIKKTKFYQASTSELYGKAQHLKMKIHPFILEVLMQYQNYMHIGFYKLSRGIWYICL